MDKKKVKKRKRRKEEGKGEKKMKEKKEEKKRKNKNKNGVGYYSFKEERENVIFFKSFFIFILWIMTFYFFLRMIIN